MLHRHHNSVGFLRLRLCPLLFGGVNGGCTRALLPLRNFDTGQLAKTEVQVLWGEKTLDRRVNVQEKPVMRALIKHNQY